MRYTQDEISNEARLIDGLHKRVHATCHSRYNSRKEQRSWSAACKEFHAHRSFFDQLMQRPFLDEVISADGNERETAITVLEVDPLHYRSGYLKGKLTQALKQADLGRQQRQRLRQVITKAAASPPQRGFRDYCKLAVKIADSALYVHFKELANSDSHLIRNRAKLMLRYLKDHGGFEDQSERIHPRIWHFFKP